MTTTDILTVEQLAEFLQCSRSQVYSLLRARKIPQGFRLGEGLRWTTESILNWARERERLQAGPVVRAYRKKR